MTTVREMLDTKGREVWSIGPDQSVYEAVALMEEKQVGALTVLSNNKMVGIVSERDCARKVVLGELASRDTQVDKIMTQNVFTVDEDATIDDCMALMSANKIRHLPVVQNDSLLGIIAVGDVLKLVIREQSAVIEELESYVMDETGGSG